MRLIQGRIRQRTLVRDCAGRAVLAIVLSVLTGCAAVDKAQPPPAPPPAAAKAPGVEKLRDGRKGFVITEIPRVDDASRADFDRAVVLLNEKAYDQAIDLLEKVIAQSPGVTAPYIDIAIAYQHLGKTEQAEEHLKTALRIFPGHPVASNEYGLLCRRNGRFAEARELYEKAVAHFPEYYPLHKNLGILCDLYLNDFSCALTQYKIYSDAVPEDEQAAFWIADLNNRMGGK